MCAFLDAGLPITGAYAVRMTPDMLPYKGWTGAVVKSSMVLQGLVSKAELTSPARQQAFKQSVVDALKPLGIISVLASDVVSSLPP